MDAKPLRALGILASLLASCILAAVYAETTASGSLDWVMKTLDYSGTAIFAVTGALAAGKKRMDIFGVVVLGCVTALGGGTLRDIILDIHPVFWILDANYLSIAVMATAITFLLSRYLILPMTALNYADAAGLAVFTVIGFQIGFQETQMYSIGILMGVMTGVVGGMIRDVLLGEIPLILRRGIYASASLCGATLYALLLNFQMPEAFMILATVSATLAFRVAALNWNLGLPVFWLKEARGKSSHRRVFNPRLSLQTRQSAMFPLRDPIARKL